MGILYFRKTGASVVRVLDRGVAQVTLPGYTKTLVVDFDDRAEVGPDSLTTLKATAGAKGDLYLTPAYLFAHGIVPDRDFIKWPDYKGGSCSETWRAWAAYQRLDRTGPVAASLRTLRGEVKRGALRACASLLVAGDSARARMELASLATGSSRAARSARALLAPGDRTDSRQVAAVLHTAVAGILAGAC